MGSAFKMNLTWRSNPKEKKCANEYVLSETTSLIQNGKQQIKQYSVGKDQDNRKSQTENKSAHHHLLGEEGIATLMINPSISVKKQGHLRVTQNYATQYKTMLAKIMHSVFKIRL